MSRTRRQTQAAPSDDEEEEPVQEPAQIAVSAADLEAVRDDCKRFTFLQAIIQKGVVKEAEARQMYRELHELTNGRQAGQMPAQQGAAVCRDCGLADAGWEDFIADINEPLDFLNLKLKRTIFNVRPCFQP